MALLEILEAPDPRLSTVCKPVEGIDAALLRLLDDMLETMYAAPGIGLAAPQVGQLRRACVIHIGKPDESEPLFLINPELTWSSSEIVVEEEGCLSLPEHFGQVARAGQVRVRYLDRAGEPQEIEGQGLLARCLQHEIDHLNGVLFIDYLSKL
jgi:peptide deformylase